MILNTKLFNSRIKAKTDNMIKMIKHNVNSINPNEIEMKQLMKVRRGKSNKVGGNSLIFYIKKKISRDHLNLLRKQYFFKK